MKLQMICLHKHFNDFVKRDMKDTKGEMAEYCKLKRQGVNVDDE